MEDGRIFEARIVKNEKLEQEVLHIIVDARIEKYSKFEIDLKELGVTRVAMHVMYGGKDIMIL